MFGAAIAILFVLPWLDKSPVRSIRYKGLYSKVALLMFVVSFLILGVLGTQSVSPAKTLLAQIMTVVYFLYFILYALVHPGGRDSSTAGARYWPVYFDSATDRQPGINHSVGDPAADDGVGQCLCC